MNRIAIYGRLGKDPEVTTTKNGKQLAKFSIAVKRRLKNVDGEYEADWFDVTVFGQQADFVANYGGKGRDAIVSGRMESRKHEGKTYWSIVADDVQFIGGVKEKPEERIGKAPKDDYDPFGDD